MPSRTSTSRTSGAHDALASKAILRRLEDVVAPPHTALLVVDLQNDYCSPDGAYSQRGHDLGMLPAVVPNVRRLIRSARDANVAIIYIQMTRLPNLRSVSAPYLRFLVDRNRLLPDDLGCELGTWGVEILPEVAPEAGDIVIPKWRSSAFVGTPLDLILRSNGIKSVVICGFATHACVESTARDALNNDYYVVLVEDCVGSSNKHLHDASLEVMRSRLDVVSEAEVSLHWAANGNQG